MKLLIRLAVVSSLLTVGCGGPGAGRAAAASADDAGAAGGSRQAARSGNERAAADCRARQRVDRRAHLDGSARRHQGRQDHRSHPHRRRRIERPAPRHRQTQLRAQGDGRSDRAQARERAGRADPHARTRAPGRRSGRARQRRAVGGDLSRRAHRHGDEPEGHGIHQCHPDGRQRRQPGRR